VLDFLKKVLAATLPIPTAAEGSLGAEMRTGPALFVFLQ